MSAEMCSQDSWEVGMGPSRARRVHARLWPGLGVLLG